MVRGSGSKSEREITGHAGHCQRIRRALEQAIALFEPRLDRVRVTMETPQQHEQALRFRVEALLRIEPAPIPVAFDAALLKTQEYMVQGTD